MAELDRPGPLYLKLWWFPTRFISSPFPENTLRNQPWGVHMVDPNTSRCIPPVRREARETLVNDNTAAMYAPPGKICLSRIHRDLFTRCVRRESGARAPNL